VGKYVSAIIVDGRLEPRMSATRTILSQTTARDADDMTSSDF
jgi:hypothetical protein